MSVLTSGIYAKLITDEIAFGVTLDSDGSVLTVSGPSVSNVGVTPVGALTKNAGSLCLRTDANNVGAFFNTDGATAWRGFTFNAAGQMVLQNTSLNPAAAWGEVADGLLGVPVVLPVNIDLGITNSPYDTVLPTGPTNWEVIDAMTICQAADAGGTAAVQTGAGVPITTTAMNCAVDEVIARAVNIDKTDSVIAAGGTLRVVYAGGGAAGRGLVLVTLLPRA